MSLTTLILDGNTFVVEQGCIAFLTLEEKYPDITRKVAKFMQKEALQQIHWIRDNKLSSVCLGIDVHSVQCSTLFDPDLQSAVEDKLERLHPFLELHAEDIYKLWRDGCNIYDEQRYPKKVNEYFVNPKYMNKNFKGTAIKWDQDAHFQDEFANSKKVPALQSSTRKISTKKNARAGFDKSRARICGRGRDTGIGGSWLDDKRVTNLCKKKTPNPFEQAATLFPNSKAAPSKRNIKVGGTSKLSNDLDMSIPEETWKIKPKYKTNYSVDNDHLNVENGPACMPEDINSDILRGYMNEKVKNYIFENKIPSH